MNDLQKSRQEALEQLNEQLNENTRDGETGSPWGDELRDYALNLLAEKNLFVPGDAGQDSHVVKRIGNDSAFADALSVRFNESDGACCANVDLFIVDRQYRSAPEELSNGFILNQINIVGKLIQAFTDGKLANLPSSHPGKQTVESILNAHAQNLIAKWKIWIITTGWWRSPGMKTYEPPRSKLPIVVEVLDLDFFRDDSEDGVSQRFLPPGLPCLVFGGSSAAPDESDEPQGYTCYLSAITGDILAHLYQKYGTKLIQENVRAYLGNNKVNKQVKETIKNQPEKFLAYNNGVVVSASRVHLNEASNGVLEVAGLQIINGGQTTTSIHQSLYNTTSANRPVMEARLKKLWVPMKIIVPDDSLSPIERRAIRDKISRAANSQTTVKSSDLASNDPFQIKFEELLENLQTPEKDYWFYERARGLYEAEKGKRKYSEKNQWVKEHPKEKLIKKTELACAWMAWNGHPQRCAKGLELAFQDFCDMCIDDASGELKSEFGVEDAKFARRLICQHFILKELEVGMKSKRTAEDRRIANPRVPCLYAIDLFSRYFGNYVDWDKIWSKQTTPDGLRIFLQKVAYRVNQCMRASMGSMMISMWGRRAECKKKLDEDFSFSGLALPESTWGLDIPKDIQLP